MHSSFTSWLVVTFLLLLLGPSVAQELTGTKITPEMLGLPDGSRRTAEPDEIRVYPTKKGNPKQEDRSKGPRWTEADGPSHELKEDEITAFHNALDFSSRKSGDAAPSRLPFKAGVYGIVVSANPGQIVVKMVSGNFMMYQHNSTVNVKIGDAVTPQTVLGKTGRVKTKKLHLHLQACDAKGHLIDPDRAFLGGRIKPKDSTPRNIKMGIPEWVDVGPIYLGRRPRVVDGVVKADKENKRLYSGDVKAGGKFGYDENAPKSPAEATPKPERERQAFLRDVASFNRDVSAHKRDLADWKRDGAVYERDRDALGRDDGVLKRDIAAFNALPVGQQTKAEYNRLQRWKAKSREDSAALKERYASLAKRFAALKKRKADIENRRAALAKREAILTDN